MRHEADPHAEPFPWQPAATLETDSTVAIEAGSEIILKSGSKTDIKAGSSHKCTAGKVDVNPPGPVPDPKAALAMPAHKHPPTS